MDVTIGTRHELGLSWILPQLDALTKAQPWLRLHLYFGSGADILMRVRSMEIECAVTSSRLTDPKLDSLRLHREDYVFVGAAALLEKSPLVRAKHAAEHTLLDTDVSLSLFRYFRDAPGGGDHLRFGSVVRLGTIEAIRARAIAQAGVAVPPAYLVKKDLAAGGEEPATGSPDEVEPVTTESELAAKKPKAKKKPPAPTSTRCHGDEPKPTASCASVVAAAFPTEGDYPRVKQSVSSEVQACCVELLDESKGSLAEHRWDCCANLPDNHPASISIACTPWGPPVPPAMRASRRVRAVA